MLVLDKLPGLPFVPDEELVWFVPIDLLQPYTLEDVFVVMNVAATKIAIPTDKSNRSIIVIVLRGYKCDLL